jgi:hypothetical protein
MADAADTSYVETVTQIRIAMAEMNVKLDQMKDFSKDLAEVTKIANKGAQSADSSHKRLDSMEEKQRWLWRTVGLTVVGGIGSIVFMVIRIGLFGKAG